jgi:hypothetical protein
MEQPRQKHKIDLAKQIKSKESAKNPTSLYLLPTRPTSNQSNKVSEKSLSYKKPNLSIEINDINPIISEEEIMEQSNVFHILSDLVRKILFKKIRMRTAKCRVRPKPPN